MCRAPLGGIAFGAISTGIRSGYTCGLSTVSRVHCWGDNMSGQLGDGTRIRRLAPVPVMGTA